MKRLILIILIASLGFVHAKEDNSRIEQLQKEIEALRLMKTRKLDQLEAAESKRWNNRYIQNEEMKLLESQSRQFESQYSTIAQQMNRKQEDILILKNALDEQTEKYNQAKSQFDGFILQVRQAVEDGAEKLDTDFPYSIAERTGRYSSMKEQLDKKEIPVSQFFEDQLDRIRLSGSQEMQTKAVLFNDGMERTVWRIRLGTILQIDLDKNSDNYQTLMRTGSVQGQRYMWKTMTDATYQEKALALLNAINKEKTAPVPLDVLQNGKIGAAEDQEQASKSLIARFKGWYAQEG